MLPSMLTSLGTDSAVRRLNFSLFKTPFPRWNFVPPSFDSFFVFYIFSYLFWRLGLLFWVPDILCWHSEVFFFVLFFFFFLIYSAFKCFFDEFVGEKVFCPSYSSVNLAPPPVLIFLNDSFPPQILISHACLTFVHHSFHWIPRHAGQQCLSICPSNRCNMIACATHIRANISKPTRMSKPAHLENYFDKP